MQQPYSATIFFVLYFIEHFLAILPILSGSDAEERQRESRIQAPEELQGKEAKTFS